MDGPSALKFGLPTSVGGLPFEDHSSAVEFALSTQPIFPTVPRLRRAGTSFIDQVASFLPHADVEEPGLLQITRPVTCAGEIHSADLESLSGSFGGTAAFLDALSQLPSAEPDELIGIRVGVLGPVTTALALRSAGVPIEVALPLGVDIAMDTATTLLDRIRPALGTKLIAVVLSESGLIGAMHPTYPLLTSQVRSCLFEAVDRIDARGSEGPLVIGIHVPGRTDWSTIITAGFSLLSLPVGTNLEGSADHVQHFLDAGGVISWGAVPVDEPLGSTDEILWRRLSSFWCSLVGAGIDPFQLRSQSLISTTAGLSHFGVAQATNALSLADSLSTRVRRQAAGTRLSLGA
ncbi:MAG: hypothetical protein V9F03_04375 [Microthrixaceae bacterium]